LKKGYIPKKKKKVVMVEEGESDGDEKIIKT
jgi:hypothetical protein